MSDRTGGCMTAQTRPFTCPECEGEGWVPVEPDCDPWDCAWGCHNGESYVECQTCEGYGVAWMAFCPRCGWDSRGYFAAQDQADAEYEWHIANHHAPATRVRAIYQPLSDEA